MLLFRVTVECFVEWSVSARVFLEEPTQEETGASTEEALELKTWNKQAKRTTDDTEVSSHLLSGTHSFLSGVLHN